VPSPTRQELRYVWLVHPDAPEGVSQQRADAAIRALLMNYILSIQGQFEQTLVVGVALPNGRGNDTSIIMAAHDKSGWTEDDFEEARRIRDSGFSIAPEANDRLHLR
jgi:glutamate 5-kinase